jgi:hypothetical protein
MGRLTLATTALCGIAAGFLGGLLVAGMVGGSFADVCRERDQMAAQQIEWAAYVKGVDADRAAATARAEKAERKAADRDKAETAAIANLFKSQALLAMVIKWPGIGKTIVSEEFKNKINADWCFPENAYKLIGGRWFLEELVGAGLVDKSALEEVDSAAARDTAGVVDSAGTRRWSVSGAKTTETFTVGTRAWRVSWRITRKRYDDPTVAVTVNRKNGGIVASMFGKGDDASVVHDSPGQFYLEAMVIGGEAEISVTEMRE